MHAHCEGKVVSDRKIAMLKIALEVFRWGLRELRGGPNFFSLSFT
jgi:hypothetical protein